MKLRIHTEGQDIQVGEIIPFDEKRVLIEFTSRQYFPTSNYSQELQEKLAMLRLVAVDETVESVGTRVSHTMFNIEVEDESRNITT